MQLISQKLRSVDSEKQSQLLKAAESRKQTLDYFKKQRDENMMIQSTYMSGINNSFKQKQSKLPKKEWINKEVMLPIKYLKEKVNAQNLMTLSIDDHKSRHMRVYKSYDMERYRQEDLRRPSKP